MSGFRVGCGIGDVTGEAAGCGMLGYGKAGQRTAGLHTRLRARAFAFEAGDDVVLLVVAELPLPMHSVTAEVLRRLAARFGGRYHEANTMIVATHTHCGPGGYSHQLVYNATTGGFRPATFAAVVDGIVEAVGRAHDDLAPARLRLARGELHGASVNRSPTAFARNPAAERAAFPDGIDPQHTLLRIERDGRLVGAVDWFATHGTSMSNRNLLVSSDNKGYAALHWERDVAGGDYLDDARPPVVAAFAQTNSGDMSPNLPPTTASGADTDGPAPAGRGPTGDEFENTRLIGQRQYAAAVALAAGPAADLEPVLDARLTHVDLADTLVGAAFTGDAEDHRTGPALAAASQLAGTDEGRGFPGFRQGRNLAWEPLSAPFYAVSRRLRAAHAPKAAVLPAGGADRLVQRRVPVQLLRIGRLYLLGIPGEPTIVAGLRLRRAVADALGVDADDVLVAGYANAYAHYVTTPEEYDEQRYEGGSTMFGRWELGAFVQTAVSLATAMAAGVPVRDGPRPRDPRPLRWARRPPADRPAGGGAFGRVVLEPHADYDAGQEVVALFAGAHLGVDVRRGGTFLEVQRLDGAQWRRIADDGDWSTRLTWTRVGRAASHVTVRWQVPPDAPAGWHRLVHHGTARTATSEVPFTGVSREFAVH